MSTAESTAESRKRTRRRLRVSCVECTRRRQKCDRQQPCGLCKSRGVVHLCRWELEPFARPPPARPPQLSGIRVKRAAPSGDDRRSESAGESSDSVVNSAQGRFHDDTSSASQSPSHQVTLSGSVTSVVEEEVKEAAIALAQLSVARRGEYLGLGSLVCCLYKVGDNGCNHQIALEKSVDLSTPWTDIYQGSTTNSFGSAFRALVISLPSKEVSDILFKDFFERNNWKYCLPRRILTNMYDRMWETLQSPSLGADTINLHWLTLLYAIFVRTSTKLPQYESGDNKMSAADLRRSWFLHGLAGRRLAEGMQCISSSSSPPPPWLQEGTIFGCLAVLLLADYLCDRGNCSEAWKIVGSAVRTAQTLGLHRNPYLYKWKDMNSDEAQLRERTWRLLRNHDSCFSFLLGRPPIVRACDTDVPLPKWPGPLPLDGSGDPDLLYHIGKAQLTEIVGEICEQRFQIEQVSYATVLGLDAKVKAWEAQLPPILFPDVPDISLDIMYPTLHRMRCALLIFYYQVRMILHRPFIHISAINELGIDSQRSRYECVTAALAAIRLQGAARKFTPPQPPYYPAFGTTFFLFDAATTLCIALLEDPRLIETKQALECLELATELLQADKEADTGGVVQQSLRVLGDLSKAIKKRRQAEMSRCSAPIPPLIMQNNQPSNSDILQGVNFLPLLNGQVPSVPPPYEFSMNGTNLPYNTTFDVGLGGGYTSLDLLQSIDVGMPGPDDGIDWQAIFDGMPPSM